MRILKRQFACVVAIGIAGAMGQSAFAQGEPAPTKPSDQIAPATGTSEEETCDPPAACAQAAPTPAPPPPAEPQAMEETPAPAPVAPMEEHEVWYDRLGMGFAVGGGVDDFASSAAKDTTGMGGSWNARITLGTRQYVAFEGSYIGSAQSIKALGLDTNAELVGNGAQAALRVNILRNFVVQPFLYGGAAWRHYDITNSNTNTSDVKNSDDVLEIPAGVGVSGYIGGFMADVRGEYRWATGEDLLPDVDGAGHANLDRWGVTGNLGFAY